jgi:Opioid growth factor receptor (OGFr) conserved region
MTDDPIVTFYSGGLDDAGRTLDEILAWSDDELELMHDYIQWIFPTVRPSAVNPSAPLVRTGTMHAFAATPELRDRLRESLDRMLRFYGLRRADSGTAGTRIEIDPNLFPARSTVWLWPGDHNHLRLTRIMQSLAALDLDADARALQRCLLEDICPGPGRGRVTEDTHEFWQAALAHRR